MADLDDKLEKFEEAKDALAQKKFTVLGLVLIGLGWWLLAVFSAAHLVLYMQGF